MAVKRKKKPEHTITVTFDYCTFGDYEKLQSVDFDAMPLNEQLDLLDAFLEEDVRTLPLSSMDEIVEAIEQLASGDDERPKD